MLTQVVYCAINNCIYLNILYKLYRLFIFHTFVQCFDDCLNVDCLGLSGTAQSLENCLRNNAVSPRISGPLRGDLISTGLCWGTDCNSCLGSVKVDNNTTGYKLQLSTTSGECRLLEREREIVRPGWRVFGE